MSAFAGELKRLRKLRLLTQKELSGLAKVPVTTISELERGVSTHPHPDTIRKLAAALGLAGAELAGFRAAARAPEVPGQGGHLAAVVAGQTAGAEPVPTAVPASWTRTAGLAAARTLPRDIGSFTGRRRELAKLLSAARSGAMAGIWVVDGMAGVGKTALAVHVAHQLAKSFPDGQIFLELRGHVPGQPPADPADALASLLQTVGVDARQIPPGTQERARLWRDRMAGQRQLLLLDDAADSSQIRPLLPGTAGCLVIVTSRSRLAALEDVRVISLDTLPPKEAAALFVRLASRPALAPGDHAVAEIVQLCGYLPLAIGILAARMRHHPAWTAGWLAADLRAAHSRSDLMTAEDLSVAMAFTLSYQDLAAGEQQLFRRLGIYPGTDIDSYAASALNGTALAVTRHNLETLYGHHLISEPAPGRYSLHDLLREHARDLAKTDPPTERHAASGRLLDYYLHTARAAGWHLVKSASQRAAEDDIGAETPPLANQQEAVDWLEAERLNLHAATIAAISDSPVHAAMIPAAVNGFLLSHGYWDQARTLSQAARKAAQRTGDRHAQATALANLAMAQRLSADFTAAIASGQHALRLYRAVSDRAGEAETLTQLGWVQYLTGDNLTAAASLSQAVELCSALDDQGSQASALIQLAHVQRVTGDSTAAAASLSSAAGLCRTLGDQSREAEVLYGLGSLQTETGHYRKAASNLNQALKLYRATSSRNDEAWTLILLSVSQIPTGMLDHAAANLNQALKILCALGNQYGEATVLHYLGIIQRTTGEYATAAASQEESLRLYRIHGSKPGEARALREIGILQQQEGETSTAATTLAQALELNQVLKDRAAEVECHNSIGDLYLASGPDPAQARDSYEQALQISRSITGPLEEAHALEGIGRCDLRQGNPNQAIIHLRQALTIYQRLGSTDTKRIKELLRDQERTE